MFFFFKQKTAYEMRISDWSSDVCSSDLFHAVLLTLRAWGEAWCKAPGAERAVEYIHCDCEGLAGPGPACAACGAPVEWKDLRAEPGVAYGKEREAHWRAFKARR